jgi:hypothetical protein
MNNTIYHCLSNPVVYFRRQLFYDAIRRAAKVAKFAAWDALEAVRGYEKLVIQGRVNKRRLRMLVNAAATKKAVTDKARTCYRGVWGSLNFNNNDVPHASCSRDPAPVEVAEAAASLATLS